MEYNYCIDIAATAQFGIKCNGGRVCGETFSLTAPKLLQPQPSLPSSF